MRVALLSSALGVLSTAAASAEERDIAPFQVRFVGELRCGSPEGFSAELLQRSQQVRPARAGEAGFVFQVAVHERQGSLHGRLELREPDGRITTRAVAGATCGEVISALAVIAAVLLEPSSSEPREPNPVSAPRPELSGWGIGASLGLSIQGAVAPQVLPGIGIEAHLGLETGSVLSPLLALAYHRTLSDGEARTDNGTAELGWWTGRASVCPVRWPGAGRLAARPCALFDVGQLEGTGVETDERLSASIVWLAPGASARLDAMPFEGILVTAEAGVQVPLNRDEFVFDPRVVAFQPPPVGGFARLALGGRFQ